KGASPVPMNRFRPNIVVEGAEPYAEETAATTRIGSSLVLRTPKRCARCQVILVDQATGLAGQEPLKTLAADRSVNHKVHFAVNAIPNLEPHESATIAVGDPVDFIPGPAAEAHAASVS